MEEKAAVLICLASVLLVYFFGGLPLARCGSCDLGRTALPSAPPLPQGPASSLDLPP